MRLSPATVVLAVGFIILLYNSGSRFSLGLMLKPMVQDLGWTRSTVALAVTLFMVVTSLALLVTGRLVDRYGPRRVLQTSIIVTALGLLPMSFIETPWQAALFYGVIFALGSAGTSVAPIGVLITRWYPERAGLANSVAISGMGVGQLLIITALASQFELLGWRGSFLALGLACVLVLLPLTLLAFRFIPPGTREDQAGRGSAATTPSSRSMGGDGPSPRGIWHSPRLWLLLLIYAVCGFQDFFAATHVVAFALDEGLGTAAAGNIFAFMGLAGLIGVLLAGMRTDRTGPIQPTLACFALRLAIFALILLSREPVVIVAFALLYGATFWVTAPLTVVFAKESFGLARLGFVTGLITMVHHSAGGLGAFVGAALFDADGNYDRAFALMLVLSGVATALTLALKLPRLSAS